MMTIAFPRLLSAVFLLTGFLFAPGSIWAQETSALPDHVIEQFGSPPIVPDGPVSEELMQAIRIAFIDNLQSSNWGTEEEKALNKITASKDPRIAWILGDRLRFTWQPELHVAFAGAAGELLGKKLQSHKHWSEIINYLTAWNIPSYPGYLKSKRAIFTNFVPGWERIFIGENMDWRLVSWGGVQIDDRTYGNTEKPCHCIPASDDPETSSPDEATWLSDNDVVFGIEINGEYRAYPLRIMEVREMINDTLGGRDFAISYCTLCGSAQAFFTDRLPPGIERPIMRTSGLLIRSNKVMYDVNTYSIFDTFLGHAVTGPLAEKQLKLKQASVVTTNWASWRESYPQTSVLVEALALGRDYNLRQNRDANGPIFPIGDVDPRLPAHEEVIGVTTESGIPIAFQRSKAFAALKKGRKIMFENIELKLEANGIKAVDLDGSDLGSHEAFWFAWSQFHARSELWPK